MGQPMNSTDDQILSMQERLIDEEADEFQKAVIHEQLGDPTENVLKELCDLVFVCYQYAACRGWDLDEAMHRVFLSNMSKLVNGKPMRRADGKILKGPNYEEPMLLDLV
jgi:predicted HAD superfamily Cof-like phosphohydrolase